MKGRINLTGIKVMASHGVFSEEKASLRPFIADAELLDLNCNRNDKIIDNEKKGFIRVHCTRFHVDVVCE